jgi:thiamine-monophosphate kinase
MSAAQPWREDEVIAAMQAEAGTAAIPVGDDTAQLPALPLTRVWTCDLVVDGVHVDRRWWPLEAIAHKAVAVNLSDLAAAGADPEALLLALACPHDVDALSLARAVAERAREAGAPLVGGDTSTSATLSLAVSALGTVEGVPLTRRGAQPGDTVYVTGPLGRAAAALRGIREGRTPESLPASLRDALWWPTPRLGAGRAARTAGATSAMDVSDGFSLDLHRLADRSMVGFALWDVPVAEGATLAEALGGGEDYELIITAPDQGTLRAAFAAAGEPPPVAVGKIVADPGVRTLKGRPLARSGWVHGAS